MHAQNSQFTHPQRHTKKKEEEGEEEEGGEGEIEKEKGRKE